MNTEQNENIYDLLSLQYEDPETLSPEEEEEYREEKEKIEEIEKELNIAL